MTPADRVRKAAEPKGGGVVIRETYTLLPKESHQLDEIRTNLARMGWNATRSEIVRAGLLAMGKMKDAKKLQALMGSVPKLKTGRPT